MPEIRPSRPILMIQGSPGFNGQGTRIQAQICFFTALAWIKSHILEIARGTNCHQNGKIRPGTLGQNWQNWTKLITTSTHQILTCDMSI